MPDLQNKDDIAAALSGLSPWEDGSPDRSPDGRTWGDENSDRQVFRRWLQRYADYEYVNQHRRDYQPFPMPATIGAALAEQRAADAQHQVEQEQREAAYRAEQAQEEAEDARKREETALAENKANADAEAERLAAEAKAQADEAARASADTRRREAERAQRLATEPGFACRERRQAAATAAGNRSPGTGAYNAAWNSFRCE